MYVQNSRGVFVAFRFCPYIFSAQTAFSILKKFDVDQRDTDTGIRTRIGIFNFLYYRVFPSSRFPTLSRSRFHCP